MPCAIVWLLSILIDVMAAFGWCGTEKPALFTQPSCQWDSFKFGFVPFDYSEVIWLTTVSVRVPFLLPLLPICFYPPSQQHAFNFQRNK